MVTDGVVVFGVSSMSEMIHFYLTRDAGVPVAAFAVDQAFLADDRFCGLPVVPFEQVEMTYPPDRYRMAVLLGFRDVNRFRAARHAQVKAKGYQFVSYVSSHAVVWPGVTFGESCFVLEGAIVQPGARIGHGVFLAPRALVGHQATVGDHCFLASHSSVLDGATVEPCCVLGAGSLVGADVIVARSCIIGAGVSIDRHTAAGEVYVGPRSEAMPASGRAG